MAKIYILIHYINYGKDARILYASTDPRKTSAIREIFGNRYRCSKELITEAVELDAEIPEEFLQGKSLYEVCELSKGNFQAIQRKAIIPTFTLNEGWYVWAHSQEEAIRRFQNEEGED